MQTLESAWDIEAGQGSEQAFSAVKDNRASWSVSAVPPATEAGRELYACPQAWIPPQA